jgi:hypothetical protein
MSRIWAVGSSVCNAATSRAARRVRLLGELGPLGQPLLDVDDRATNLVEPDPGQAHLGLHLVVAVGHDDDGLPGADDVAGVLGEPPVEPDVDRPRMWPLANTSGDRPSTSTAPSLRLCSRPSRSSRGGGSASSSSPCIRRFESAVKAK